MDISGIIAIGIIATIIIGAIITSLKKSKIPSTDGGSDVVPPNDGNSGEVKYRG